MENSLGLIEVEGPSERVLRCRKSQRYWSSYGWTEDPQRALIFEDAYEAVRACSALRLQHVYLSRPLPSTAEVLVASLM